MAEKKEPGGNQAQQKGDDHEADKRTIAGIPEDLQTQAQKGHRKER